MFTDDQQTTCGCELAASWAVRGYSVEGHEARIEEAEVDGDGCGGRVVFVDSLRVADWILDESSPTAEIAPRIAALRSEGWEVSAVVPLATLQPAHSGLPTADHLQGWWLSSTDRISFTRAELP